MSSAPSSASGRRCRRRSREAAGATLADRPGDARQSRTDRARSRASARGSLLAAIDRTVTAAGLAPAGAAPRRTADRSGGDRAAPRRRRASSSPTPRARSDTRERLKAAPDLARALARLVGRTRRPARSRRDPRRHRRSGRAGRRSSQRARRYSRRDRRKRPRRLRAPDPAIATTLTAALADELPLSQARRRLRARQATSRRSTRRARLRDESRRVIAAPAGALCRRDRRRAR